MRSLLLFTFSFLLGSNSTFSQTNDSYDIPRIITQRKITRTDPMISLDKLCRFHRQSVIRV